MILIKSKLNLDHLLFKILLLNTYFKNLNEFSLKLLKLTIKTIYIIIQNFKFYNLFKKFILK